MTEAERALLQCAEGKREQIVALLAELVAIPTVNPYSGDDSAGIETTGQEWIERRFRKMGAATRRIEVPGDVYERGGVIGPVGRSWADRFNVVAEWTLGSGDGPTVLLNDHMDTVGTAGMEIPPFDTVVRDGRMYGRGTSDAKGNMVAGLMAVAALIENADGLGGRVLFESVVDEECSGGGAGTLACCLAGITADRALCLDGGGGIIHVGCNGIATARVRVAGKAGHGSLKGAVNAIDKGIFVKEAIDAFGRSHEAAYPNCLTNVGVFRSGVHPAIVPDEAELQINMNYAVADARRAEAKGRGWGGALFRERFEDAMRRLADSDPWLAERPVEVTWDKDLYPYAVPADGPFIQAVSRALEEALGRPTPTGNLDAWFDGSHLSRQLRIPVAGVGAATPGQAHSAAEHIVLDDLVGEAKAVALILRRALTGEA